jgi:hypothetical protein
MYYKNAFFAGISGAMVHGPPDKNPIRDQKHPGTLT